MKCESNPVHESNSVGGKGRGGRWLFVSHDPVNLPTSKNSSHQYHCHQSYDCSRYKDNFVDGEEEKYKSCIELLGMQELQSLIAAEKDISKSSNGEGISALRGPCGTSNSEKINTQDADVVSDNTIFTTALADVPKLFCQPSMTRTLRMIHFKFEPMILHILTASLAQANRILIAAVQAGFRESGAINLLEHNRENIDLNHPPQNIQSSDKNKSALEKKKNRKTLELEATPMVAIRSNGLALESIVGIELNGRNICMIPEWQMRGILLQANQRFIDNTQRINRFANLLMEKEKEYGSIIKSQSHLNRKAVSASLDWEDPVERRARKRQEGLYKAKIKAGQMKYDEQQSTQGLDNYYCNLEDLESSWYPSCGNDE
ncbi:hypothetical protein HI914_02898 [Erysiphe necator]|nr:hypothetical protein HI914_02898 [Erysiphe necator]